MTLDIGHTTDIQPVPPATYRRDPVTTGLFSPEDDFRFVDTVSRGCEECEAYTPHDIYSTDFFFAGPGISTHGYRRTSMWFLCSACGEYGFADPSDLPR